MTPIVLSATRAPLKPNGQQAVIRIYKNWIDVSADGKHPLPRDVFRSLAAELTYTKIKALFGRDIIIDDSGKQQKMSFESRRLYRFDDSGLFGCGRGFIDRVEDYLIDLGYCVSSVDLNRYDRPVAFTANWGRLAKYPEFHLLASDAADLKRALDAGELPDVGVARRVKQNEILRVMDARIIQKRGGGVKVPPGVGKSTLLAAVGVIYNQARIGISVPDIDNFNKTYKHLLNYTGAVGRVGDGHLDLNSRITVITKDSLHRLPEQDILLVDEAHKYNADRAAGALARQGGAAIHFAFTATMTGRFDGTDARMEATFGRRIYDMGWPEAVKLGLVVPIEVHWLDVRCDNPIAGVTDHVRRARFGLWRNRVRNKAIALAAQSYGVDDQVLIMVNRVEHALYLRKLLPEYQLCYGVHDVDKFLKHEKDGLIDDTFVPMNPGRREEMREDFTAGTLKKVIATSVWSTGVSFDSLSVLIRADAESSEITDEQIPGRVSRVHNESGKQAGVVIDFNDLYDERSAAASRKRKGHYADKGWKQYAGFSEVLL